ncbi:MAG TPA: ThuA domain-containing protein [Gemmatimonadales bacterium]
MLTSHAIFAPLAAAVVACNSRGMPASAAEVCPVTSGAAPAAPPPAHAPFRVLVFSRTTGFRHASIPAAITAVEVLGSVNNFTVEATEDATAFTDSNLARFAAVVFLNTTGDVLDSTQQAAFERYVRAGHGFVGVHSASDTEYGWPWYHALLGATFDSHPPIQQATVVVVDTGHASTRSLPSPWVRTDEWYNFRAEPTAVSVLAKVDEATYSGGKMGAEHPISWQHVFEGGRAWYTAMGHTACSYSERPFLDHLLGGIEWAAGVLE